MNIQTVNNNNISSKGLYFTKSTPLISKKFHYSSTKDLKISDHNVRYIEDKATPANIKESIAKTSLVKKLSSIYDVFVQYMGEKYNKNIEEYKAWIRLYITDEISKKMSYIDFIELDAQSSKKAREKILKSLNEET